MVSSFLIFIKLWKKRLVSVFTPGITHKNGSHARFLFLNKRRVGDKNSFIMHLSEHDR